MSGTRCMHHRARATGLAALLLAPAAALAVDWQDLGPAPVSNGSYTGRVSAVVCSPTDANRYYVGGADGGVWRTTDGGASWTPLTDQMPNLAIGALALDPTNESIIYAGTGEANYANHSRYGLGIYKSVDGGQTWTHLGEAEFGGRTIARILVHPTNPQTVYVAVARAGGFPALAAAKNHPGANGPVGVFRSDDGGLTWSQMLNGLPDQAATDLAMHPTSPDVLYAGIGHIFGAPENGIYKTVDGGASWSKLAGGLPSQFVGRISLAVAPSNPARLYTLIAHSADANGGGGGTLGAWRSDNHGASWSSLPVGSIQATYGWYLSVVSVQPTNANTVFMGGLDLVRSTDSGGSWNYVTPPHVDMHAAAWDAAGRLVVGDDGGVHRTDNLGNSWIALNNGLGVIQFYAGLSTHPTQVEYLLGGTQDNGSNRRNAPGVLWTQVFGGDGGWTQIDQANPLRSFVEYQGTGNLYRSLDGGTTYNYSGNGINGSDRNCFLPPYLIQPNNSNRMFYGTHRLYRSIDGGTNWTAISPDLTGGTGAIRSLAIAPSNPNVIYAATNSGRIQRSDNGGTSFTLIASDIPGWPRCTRELFVHPTEPLTVYLAVAAFGHEQVRRSIDGGASWELLAGDLPDIPVNTVAVDVRGRLPVLYAGADDGVYRSIFDGTGWHRYGVGLPNACVIDLRLEPGRGRLIAATQGRGAWRIPIGIPGDLNNDGTVGFDDINPFVLALANPVAYALEYPNADPVLLGDMNGDNVLDFSDINGFVMLLSS